MANWDKDDTIIVLYEYHLLGGTAPTMAQKERIAKLINKSAGSVKMKMDNFASLDPNSNRKGLEHPSRLDKEVWDKYCKDLRSLAHDAKQAKERKLDTIHNQNNSIIGRIIKLFFK